MKLKLLTILLAAGLVLAACGEPAATVIPTDVPISAPTPEPATAVPEPTTEPTQIPVDLTPAQLAAIQDLAVTLNIDVAQIQLVSTEAVDWPDGCLGVHLPDVMCTQAIVPGFNLLLAANGQPYEYHTNQDGSVVVNATAAVGRLQVAYFAPDRSVQLIEAGIQPGAATTGLPPFGGAVGGTVYALDLTTSTVVARDESGTHTLDFIQRPSYGLAVSNGNGGSPLIAWATAPTDPSTPTELHVSRLDGAEAQVVVSELLAEGTPPYQLVALGFTPDGSGLYYSREPYGIGGYIPYTAVSSLYRYNFSDQSVTELVAFNPEAGGTFLCLDALTADQALLADHCGDTVNVTNLADGSQTSITPPAEATGWAALGTARFSPDNSRVAFALAKRDPENEQGWVAVSDGLEGGSKVILTSEPGSYYSVVGWLNADTLLVQLTPITTCSTECALSLWTVKADGSNLTKFADGGFIAVVEN